MRRSHALTAAAIAVASLVSVAAWAGQEKREHPGINNYTQVDAVVACGGATDVQALDALKKEGFTSVVNLRQSSERGANVEASMAEAKAVGLKYFHLPINGGSPDPAIVDQFLQVVSTKANQPVFIHCASANRVGMVWLVKRVLQDKWTIEKATAEAHLIGLTSPALEKFALDYIGQHKP
ncbi:MAG: sulfur transferase domain-containing protein [Vicinamibacterales bacterium]